MRLFVVVLAITSTACFSSAKHRRIAKISEGAVLATGIVMQLVAGKSACMTRRPGTTLQPCDDGKLDEIGVVLIFAALAGFAATTISGMDDSPPAALTESNEPAITPAPPLAFCSALWANDVTQAEAALNSYVRSLGVVMSFDAMEALGAYLSRQPCITVGDDVDDPLQQIEVIVRDRNQRYVVDATDPQRIILHVMHFVD